MLAQPRGIEDVSAVAMSALMHANSNHHNVTLIPHLDEVCLTRFITAGPLISNRR